MTPAETPVITPAPAAETRPKHVVPVIIGCAVVVVLAAGGYLYHSAAARTNDVALDSAPKIVTIVEAEASTFRPSRRYVATVEPWLEARVGPELISGYVDTVAYRPGATVKKGDVLATLDCRTASAEAQSVAMTAKALEAKQEAIGKEAERVKALLDKGFESQQDADRKLAESASQQADILATKAKLLGTSLEVDDCILRAPFDGEIAMRAIDPGAFVRPGGVILTVVQRDVVRISTDVPEVENNLVAPQTTLHIHFLANDKRVDAPVSRRSPGADSTLRTIHIEADIPDPDRTLPVGTTAEVMVDVGQPLPAAELPLSAVSIRGDHASLFVIEGDVAKKMSLAVVGEAGSRVFLDPSIAGKKVVTEGRALLNDGDHVKASGAEEAAARPASTEAKARP